MKGISEQILFNKERDEDSNIQQKTINSANPEHFFADQIPILQKNIGNIAVHRMFKSYGPQTRPKTVQSNEPCEQEADQISDRFSRNEMLPTNDLSSIKPTIQRAPAENASTSSTETPQAPPTTEETPAEETTPTPGLIVEDTATEPAPGQMKKSDFLSQLKASVCGTAEAALAGTIWSVMGCPWIVRWFDYYSGRSSQQIERAIQKYAPGAAGITSATDYIPIITSRVRSAIATWSETGEITGVPEGVPTGSAAEESPSPEQDGVLFKGQEGTSTKAANPQHIQTQLGTGSPLESGVRSKMESAFSQSFSNVRIHTDTKGAQISDNLNARAFTIGSNIAFGRGEYQPGTLIGDALIAHELAHTIQQGGGRSGTVPMQKGEESHSSLEEDADISAVGAVASLWSGMRGGLADISKNAMPRLRSGLRLQRCKKKKKKAKCGTKEPMPADPHAVYEQKLSEAITLLNGVQFGRAVGRYVGSDAEDQYDTNYWREEADPNGDAMLVLKSGKCPSDAIDAMFDHLDRWQVDCAEFIQIAQWYALRHSLGADEFNKRVRGLSFRLRPHGSTGIKTKEKYYRSSPGATMKRKSDGMPESKSIAELIADAPIGTRVTWTNLDAPTTSAFRHENTIKLGADLFAAHGFGGSRNIFSRAEIELKIAREEDPSADAAYIATNIFISQIEYYKTP